jgi:hypothetical protein
VEVRGNHSGPSKVDQAYQDQWNAERQTVDGKTDVEMKNCGDEGKCESSAQQAS